METGINDTLVLLILQNHPIRDGDWPADMVAKHRAWILAKGWLLNPGENQAGVFTLTLEGVLERRRREAASA
jgi:hypothetical protein